MTSEYVLWNTRQHTSSRTRSIDQATEVEVRIWVSVRRTGGSLTGFISHPICLLDVFDYSSDLLRTQILCRESTVVNVMPVRRLRESGVLWPGPGRLYNFPLRSLLSYAVVPPQDRGPQRLRYKVSNAVVDHDSHILLRLPCR